MRETITHKYNNFDVQICELSHTGEVQLYETVLRPECVIIIPIKDDSSIMITEFRTAINQWIRQFPSGKIIDDINELPIEAAKRELLEETGYTAEKFDYLGRFYTAPHFSNELFHLFIARGLKLHSPNPTKRELIKVFDVKRSLLEDTLFCSNSPIDAKTITAFYFWMRGVPDEDHKR